jgi:hypothetical protein
VTAFLKDVEDLFEVIRNVAENERELYQSAATANSITNLILQLTNIKF